MAKKKSLCTVLVCLMCGISTAGTYVYDSGVSGWYGSGGFTGVTGGTGNICWDPTDPTGINTKKLDGGGMVFFDDFGGANWQVPAGEIVTRVEMIGSYRDDYHTLSYNYMGAGILGGTSAYDTTIYQSIYSLNGADFDGNNIRQYSTAVDIPQSHQVTQIQLRSWWHQYGYGISVNPWGGRIDAVTITTVKKQQKGFTVPSIKAIGVDGDLSDWMAASEWSDEFIWWNGDVLTSQTRAKFAYNDARDMLYVAIETDEASVRPGGHAVVGFGTGLDQTAYLGDGATQLAFQTMAGGNSVKIFNEIHEYKINIYPEYTADFVDSGFEGVQAAYSYNGGKWTYEIAIPMWTNWALGQMTTKTNLIPDNTVYVYAMMQDKLGSVNGMNMTYYGNPGFANPGGFANAAFLILAGPAAMLGDANGDFQVDVGDLGILAANYGNSGKCWEQGDFNHDGLVDVGDLGILAANYGSSNFSGDYAKTFGTVAEDDTEDETVGSSMCNSLGLPLIAGLLLMGLMLVKLEE